MVTAATANKTVWRAYAADTSMKSAWEAMDKVEVARSGAVFVAVSWRSPHLGSPGRFYRGCSPSRPEVAFAAHLTEVEMCCIFCAPAHHGVL